MEYFVLWRQSPLTPAVQCSFRRRASSQCDKSVSDGTNTPVDEPEPQERWAATSYVENVQLMVNSGLQCNL